MGCTGPGEGGAHSFLQRATTPTAQGRPERSRERRREVVDSGSDSDSPTTKARARAGKPDKEKDTLSRKRADSAGTASAAAKRINVAGWASSAVSSVASIGRSGPKDGSRDRFATLDDEASDEDACRRRRADGDSDEE